MIGVLDSGYGGLTVLKEFLKLLPQYDYMYLGDNARAPYGNRSHDTVKEFAKEGIDYLFKQGCVLIIIACNTASSQVLREIQEEYLRAPNVTDKKILGVLKPIVEETVKLTKNGRVGVVGTRSTINAKSYEVELHHLNPEIKVCTEACPLLVPLIEEGWIKKPETRMIMRKYLRPIKSCNVDTLILGCTHYPILKSEFRKIMGKKVNVPNPGKVVANSLEDYLNRHPEIESLLTKNKKTTYCTTDDPEKFQKMGKKFLGMDIKEVHKVNINK
jgi:glutamate racemase